MTKIILDIKNVNQWYMDGNKINHILHDINLKIVQGQFVALVGSSGCGKSTLLKSILGTNPPKSGKILENGREIVKPTRDIGIVYQKYGLYQFLTAEQNVAFGLMLDKTNLPTRAFLPFKWLPMRNRHLAEAREILTKFKLDHAFKRYPFELSGGMQQRVAIAQSLIMKPKVLLLDEPFGALDESTREDLQKVLLTLYAENLEAKKAGLDPPWTVIFVTHELNEAFYVSDRLVALSKNWYDDLGGSGVLGATKVWDKCTPVYSPEEPKNFDLFYHTKNELKESVLDPKSKPIHRDLHVSFWDELEKGVGTGISSKELRGLNAS